MHDSIKPIGRVRIEVRNSDGSIAQVEECDNLVVDAGLNLLRDFLSNSVATTGLSYVAFGLGTTAPAASDTRLTAEVYRQTITDTFTSNDTLNVVAFVPSAATAGNFTELGLFGNNASATTNSGTLFAHTLPSVPIVKYLGQTVTVQWTITL